MKRRRIIVLAALVTAIVLATIVLWPEPREPEYHGRKLSYWIDKADETGFSFVRPENEPVTAVKSIGTNGIPFFLKWVAAEDPTWSARLRRHANRLPKFPGRNALVDSLSKRAQAGFDARHRGLSGFQILGLEAASAVPALTKIAREGTKPRARFYALRSLAFLGPGGVKPVLEVLRDTNEPADVRYAAADALRFMPYLGSGVAPAIPDLIAYLGDTNKLVSVAAARALKCFAMRATPIEYGLPNLPRMSRSEDEGLRSATIQAVRDALTDPYTRVSAEAVEPLRLISPSVLPDRVTNLHE